MIGGILLFHSILLVTWETAFASSVHSVSVYCHDGRCHFRSGVLDWGSATAVGTYNDTLLTTGWGVLDISAGHAKNVSVSNTDIMLAAGFAEGFLTARQMDHQYKNIREAVMPPSKDFPKKLRRWLAQNRKWADTMVVRNRDKRPIWRHVGYILAQLDGLLDGYRAVSANVSDPLDEHAVSFLNSLGDMDDLQDVLDGASVSDWANFTQDQARRHFSRQGHCSALVKLLPGFENIYMGHSTWFMYQGTNRIFKHYDLNVDDDHTAAKKISFSSYPGCLESNDDFYILGSGIVMLQTSLEVFNQSLYDDVTFRSLLAWLRVRVASMMAKDGEQWTEVVKQYNSGTYNNEYVVIDLNKFTPKEPLKDGTLWVADQMPGLVVAEDVTDALRSGYFPSYNIPYFRQVFDKLGYAEYVKTHGNDYSYSLAPRAKIFRRDQTNVADLSDMKGIMRYNDYQHDPYSDANPLNTICSRGDLDEEQELDGCFDTKVTDYSMAKTLQADVINGPTLSHDLPVFSWTGPFVTQSHEGLPQSYNFTFLRTGPRFP